MKKDEIALPNKLSQANSSFFNTLNIIGKDEDGSGGRGKKKTLGKNLPRVSKTTDIIGKDVGISGVTIIKYKAIQKEASEELKQAVDSGEMSISAGYDAMRGRKAEAGDIKKLYCQKIIKFLIIHKSIKNQPNYKGPGCSFLSNSKRLHDLWPEVFVVDHKKITYDTNQHMTAYVVICPGHSRNFEQFNL